MYVDSDDDDDDDNEEKEKRVGDIGHAFTK